MGSGLPRARPPRARRARHARGPGAPRVRAVLSRVEGSAGDHDSSGGGGPAMIATARTWLTDVERFLLPNACLACGRLVERDRPDRLVCRVCHSRIVADTG